MYGKNTRLPHPRTPDYLMDRDAGLPRHSKGSRWFHGSNEVILVDTIPDVGAWKRSFGNTILGFEMCHQAVLARGFGLDTLTPKGDWNRSPGNTTGAFDCTPDLSTGSMTSLPAFMDVLRCRSPSRATFPQEHAGHA